MAIFKLLSAPIWRVVADLLLFGSFLIDQHVLLVDGHSLLKMGRAQLSRDENVTFK